MEHFGTEYQLLQAYHLKRTSGIQTDSFSFHCEESESASTEIKTKSSAFSLGCAKRRLKTNYKLIEKDGRTAASANTDPWDDVADKLTHIVDCSSPAQDEFVTINQDDLIQKLVMILREAGDKLNEKIKKDSQLLGYLQSSFSYNSFERLASTFITSVVPGGRKTGEASEQKARIAWTCEMTSRLSTLDLQPMKRVLGFGAQYLNQMFGSWVQQRGGWEEVLNTDDSVLYGTKISYSSPYGTPNVPQNILQ